MGANSDIEWTDATWNPTRGCSLVSDGCTNCYAMKFAHRFSGAGGRYEGLTVVGNHGPRWSGRVLEVPEMLAEPLRWTKPRRIFVDSMSDLFHEEVSDRFIAAVFGAMAQCRRHTFQVLTKRAERMARWFEWLRENAGGGPGQEEHVCGHAFDDLLPDGMQRPPRPKNEPNPFGVPWVWPLPNVWLGVSVEDQRRADERIPHLLRTPAAVRFLSCEPLLGPVTLWHNDNTGGAWRGPGVVLSRGMTPSTPNEPPEGYDDSYVGIDWVIVGGESGPGARPFHCDRARSIVKQCRVAGVACFVKQLGANVRDRNDAGFQADLGYEGDEWSFGRFDPDECVEHNPNGYREEYQGAPVRIRLRHGKGGDMSEWPKSLQVREFPAVQP